jgi:transposase
MQAGQTKEGSGVAEAGQTQATGVRGGLTGASERREPERSDGERSGGAPVTDEPMGTGIRPDPEVLEKPKRRKFTAAYKRKIVEQAKNASTEPGGVGALLRREGLYWSYLRTWRGQYGQGGLRDHKRGRKATKDPLQRDVDRLQEENARLKRDLEQAEAVIEIQKKVSDMLGLVRKTEES